MEQALAERFRGLWHIIGNTPLLAVEFDSAASGA